MLWSKAGHDVLYKHSVNHQTMASAIQFCKDQGYGYDILLPRFKYHTRKSYAENFKYKGDPVEAEEED